MAVRELLDPDAAQELDKNILPVFKGCINYYFLVLILQPKH